MKTVFKIKENFHTVKCEFLQPKVLTLTLRNVHLDIIKTSSQKNPATAYIYQHLRALDFHTCFRFS